MHILNFTHPLSARQVAQIEALCGRPVTAVHDLAVQFDVEAPFAPQMDALMERLPLSPAELQTEALLVVLPALNHIAALLIAELHGRAGYFPTILRLRPVAAASPPEFEAAELINLQAVRDQARRKR